MANERLFELRRRTFDTPHFRGIEFIEVEAKSILNHVPGSYLPFNWTINAYRGCTHACSYCLSGDTLILMADGRTRPLSEVRTGDEIYGTARRGSYRRYVTTKVLHHWATVKRAYRITLSDGTELIASGDHRFLTERGWKYVTGAEQGAARRPHLTTNNRLLGTGRFAAAPAKTADYRRGYLCGMIRGDGNVGTYDYVRPRRSRAIVHRFRLALKDFEALQRTRRYLDELDVATTEFVFQEAVGRQNEIHAIRTAAKRSVNRVRRLCEWPETPSEDWCRGFLAGIFDAEGGCSRGVLRISNTDGDIIIAVAACLDRFGFRYAVEEPRRAAGKPITVLRLVGGLRERLRFFHAVDPAITRKRAIAGTAIKASVPLRIVSIEPLGLDMPMYDITTGTGDFIANGVVSHNCFARTTHTYMDMNAGRDFETKIVVKVNAPELLRKELRAKKWKGEPIAMGTATDPYQRAEGKYRLTRAIVETLGEFGNPFSILTKGTLILRDLDLLQEAASVTDVSTAFSIGTLDEDVWRKSEPGTPHPRKRIEAVATLNAAGIPCAVLVAPVLPGISDSREQLKEVVTAALDAGATNVSPILLHLRPGVKEVYLRWLEDEFPELVPKYRAMYPGAYASRADKGAFGATMKEVFAEARTDEGASNPATARRRKPRARFDKKERDALVRVRQQRAALDNEQLRLL